MLNRDEIMKDVNLRENPFRGLFQTLAREDERGRSKRTIYNLWENNNPEVVKIVLQKVQSLKLLKGNKNKGKAK